MGEALGHCVSRDTEESNQHHAWAKALDLETCAEKRDTRSTGKRQPSVLDCLREGNRRFLAGTPLHGKGGSGAGSVEGKALPSGAVAVLCAPIDVPVERLFDLEDDAITVSCAVGGVAPPCSGDGALGTLDFALGGSQGATMALVLQPQGSTLVRTAVEQSMRSKSCGSADRALIGETAALPTSILEAASDALHRHNERRSAVESFLSPRLNVDAVCKDTEELVVWHTIRQLFAQSSVLRAAARSCEFSIEGAVLNSATLEVRFMGPHPDQPRLISDVVDIDQRVPDDALRRQPVPADEAYALLRRGSVRAATARLNGTGRHSPLRSPRLSPGNSDDGMGKARPVAVVVYDFEMRTPSELLFDLSSGQLFSFWFDSADSAIDDSVERLNHSVEYSICHHMVRLLVVLKRLEGCTNISLVQKDIESIMQKLLDQSDSIRAAVADGDVQLRGAVLDPAEGGIVWLGRHHLQATVVELTQVPSQMAADAALAKLREGHARYVAGASSALACRWAPGMGQKRPLAVVVSGSFPKGSTPELLFDAEPGELLVQRLCASIAGRPGRCQIEENGRGGVLQESLDCLVGYSAPSRGDAPLLLVLGDVRCPAMAKAVRQAQGLLGRHKSPNAQLVLDQLGPAALHAILAMPQSDIQMPSSIWSTSPTSSGSVDPRYRRFLKPQPTPSVAETDGEPFRMQRRAATLAAEGAAVERIAAELNVIYVMERLLLDSAAIGCRARAGTLQLHGAVIEADGAVKFLGEHPDANHLLAKAPRLAKRRLGQAASRRADRTPAAGNLTSR